MTFRRFFTLDFASQAVESGTVIAAAVPGYVMARGAGWPFERGQAVKSQKQNTLSSLQILSQLLRNEKKDLVKTYAKTGIKQTIGKGVSIAGVSSWVNYTWPHLDPLSKGLVTTLFSTPLATWTTYSDEQLRISDSLKKAGLNTREINIHDHQFKKEKRNIIKVTGGREAITGVITFTAIDANYKFIKPYFPESTPDSVIKAIAASSASCGAQVFNMPFINFYTYVLAKPHPSLVYSMKQFWKEEHLAGLFRGLPLRSCNRAIVYGVSFFWNFYTEKSIKQLKIAQSFKETMEKPTSDEEYIRTIFASPK